MATSGGFQQSVYLLATEPADISAITVAEITAGTPVHPGLPDPVSFSGTTNQMDTSVIASRQDRSEPGTLTLEEITIEPFRNPEGDLVVAAVTPDSDFWLVKFEGGNIAGGDHTTPAIGDTYDAVKVVAGSRSDVDTPRPDPRRTAISLQIADTIEWDGTVA
jgi:hypothetical protein